MKNHLLSVLTATVLLSWTLHSCKKDDILEENPATTGLRSSELISGQQFMLDIPQLYQEAKGLERDTWLPLAQTEYQYFPIVKVRKAVTIREGAMTYTTDGKSLTSSRPVQVLAVEGETNSGGKAMFAINEEHISGWYETTEGRYFFQDLKFEQPSAPAGKIAVISEAVAATMIPNAGCATADVPHDQGEHAGQVMPMPEANCWKLEVLPHGDWHYFSGPGSGSVNNSEFGLLAYILWSDPPYEAINSDLVITDFVLTTTPTNFTTEAVDLLNIVRGFWSQFPFTQRDMVLYVTGANIRTGSNYSTAGIAYVDVVCNNYPYAVGVAEWLANNSVGMGRLGAHEMGHMMGANHTSCPSGGVMYGNISSTCSSSSFTQVSRDEMNWHIWFNNGCLYQATCD